MNQQSSRSHFIITFDIESIYYMDYDEQKPMSQKSIANKNYYEVKKQSKILFIDLAGSEKQGQNNSKTVEEGCYINKSLSVLNHIIKSLSKKSKSTFKHYRDSKLTHFLKEIFNGNSFFSIIGHILPYQQYINESLNTLNFVSLAKTIETNPVINFVTKNNTTMMKKQIQHLLEKIELL